MSRIHWLPLCAVLLLCGCGDGTPVPAGQGAPRPLTADDIASNNRGVAQMGYFDYTGARETFRRLVERRPDWQAAKVNLAIATLNRQADGDEAQALTMVNDVLRVEPDNVRAHYVSGLLQLYKGDVASAAGHFSAVLDADPHDAYAAYFLGQCVESEDPGRAMALYERAIELDPYLRSAYYRLALAQRQQGERAAAARNLEIYTRFNNNPRAQLAEFKYTRMGEKGNAVAVGVAGQVAAEPPAGALFEAAQILHTTSDALRARSLTTVDLDNDYIQDLFIAGGAGAPSLLLRGSEDEFQVAKGHPLALVTDVIAVAWGDIDNDGQVDAFLCRNGKDQLWMQRADGSWRNVSAASKTGGSRTAACRDVAMVDADHDGDLDILVADDQGVQLFNNNLDGTFRPLAGENGLDFGAGGARQIIVNDIDNDRDADLIVVKNTPPHVVLLNDRLWRYQPAEGLDALIEAPLAALVSADVNADGRSELYAAGAAGAVLRWQRDSDNHWQATQIGSWSGSGEVQLGVAELDGDGRPDLLLHDAAGIRVLAPGEAGGARELFVLDGEFAAHLLLLDAPRQGPGLVVVATVDGQSELQRYAPGPGRGQFVTLSFSGKEEQSESMRSNRSGIGTRAALRSGSLWSMADSYDHSSAPGQSLQPLALGVGSMTQADFVALQWSDGVFQTELDLPAGQVHRITETQRQLSSCPVVFSWDGERYRFVSDVLGVAGIGFMVEPGVYSSPRPWEYFALPAAALKPVDGRLRIKISEPMEEIAYIDQVRLHVVDLAPDWHMVVDERMQTGQPQVTGAPLYYRRETRPMSATDGAGNDVRDVLLEADGIAVSPGPLDARFIGRTRTVHSVTLHFANALDAADGRPVLVADGWVEYPYSQTVFAAWQAGAAYTPPTLEAATADGRWQTVYPFFGYPAGMPRTMALPLDDLPAGTVALRLTSSLQLYWDRIAVVYAEQAPARRRDAEAALLDARVAAAGFAKRLMHAQRRPDYDYAARQPFWDSRYLDGSYTAIGDAVELVAQHDDAFAIIGPGEEVHLEFASPPAAPDGWQRRYILETRGFAKDMDMFTDTGGRVAPLPQSMPGERSRRADELHMRYNTRYQAGHQ